MKDFVEENGFWKIFWKYACRNLWTDPWKILHKKSMEEFLTEPLDELWKFSTRFLGSIVSWISQIICEGNSEAVHGEISETIYGKFSKTIPRDVLKRDPWPNFWKKKPESGKKKSEWNLVRFFISFPIFWMLQNASLEKFGQFRDFWKKSQGIPW